LIRAAVWALYPLLTLAYSVALFTSPAGQLRFGILETIYLIPVLGTVALGIAAARASAHGERRYWGIIALANALLGTSEFMLVWWLVSISPKGPPPVMWPFQIMHVITACCFVALAWHMTRLRSEPLLTRARVGLDLAALGVMTYAVIVVVYARPLMTLANAPVYAILVGAGYALAAFMMMIGTLGNIVGFKMVRWRSWETLTAAGIGVYSCAVALWPLWYTSVAGSSRNLERGTLDLIQFSGHFILGMAAVYKLTESANRDLRPLAMPSIIRRGWVGAILPALSATAVFVLGYAAFAQRDEPTWFAVFGVMSVLLTVLVLVRSLLLTMEHGRLFVQSVTDPLTGLFNHRHFQHRLGAELDRAARYAEKLSVVELDLDDFGDFNARFGHLEGDRLLSGLGSRLGSLVSGDAFAARLGGDEFGVVLPGYDASRAAVFTQHLIDVISVEFGASPGQLSASAGVATYPDHGASAPELLHLADGALFHAKENGKSRVIVYDPLRVPDLSARERIERLERNSRISAVRALAAAVDARNPDSQSHAQRVAERVAQFGRFLEMSEDGVRALELLAVVHDVGQIAVADAVLKKPGSLSPSDWEQMRRHPEHGQRILASTGLTELVPAVRSHHERWDGAGYPDGLAGAEIPFEARVLALCDAYETMIAEQEHSPAMSAELAQREIAYGAGTQFDPELAARLLEMLGTDIATVSIDEPTSTGREAVEIRLRSHSAASDVEAQRT
jgi:diguanylate cyclase (GGDEF)-like protein